MPRKQTGPHRKPESKRIMYRLSVPLYPNDLRITRALADKESRGLADVVRIAIRQMAERLGVTA